MLRRTEEEIKRTWDCQNNTHPVTSVICTTYNHADFVERAMDGILSQITQYPFEVICHDDCSTDGTQDILMAYKKKYPSIIHLTIENENVYSKNSDRLFDILRENINGEFVAFCEGDDYWFHAGKLERQIVFMKKHYGYAMSFHPVYYVAMGKIVGNDKKSNFEMDVSSYDVIEGGGIFCATPSLVLRRDVYLDVREFQRIAKVGDYPLQILSASRGKVRYFSDIMGCYTTWNPMSWTGQIQDNFAKINGKNNTIEYLKLYDEDTGKKFSESVNFYIGKMIIEIESAGGVATVSFEEVYHNVNGPHKKELDLLKKREILKKRFRVIYKIYQALKYDLKKSKLFFLFYRKAPVPRTEG